MGSYRIIPHTADLRIRIEAFDLPDLFTTSLESLNYVIKKDFDKNQSLMYIKEVIHVNSIDYSMMLIDFLSTVLTLSHQYKVIFNEVNFLKFSGENLIAELSGCKVDNFIEDVKAVTYNETEIKVLDNGKLETNIVIDI